jgi:hypothetical protein
MKEHDDANEADVAQLVDHAYQPTVIDLQQGGGEDE